MVLVHATADRCEVHASEVLEQFDLAQGTLREDLLAEDIGDLFDSHALAGLVVGCSTSWHLVSIGHEDRAGRVVPHDAVSTLSELLGHIVALVDDELLVEHLAAVSRAGLSSSCGARAHLEHLAVGEVAHGG